MSYYDAGQDRTDRYEWNRNFKVGKNGATIMWMSKEMGVSPAKEPRAHLGKGGYISVFNWPCLRSELRTKFS